MLRSIFAKLQTNVSLQTNKKKLYSAGIQKPKILHLKRGKHEAEPPRLQTIRQGTLTNWGFKYTKGNKGRRHNWENTHN